MGEPGAARQRRAQQQASQEIYLLAYGNGASLAKTLIERNMARMLSSSAYNTAPESPATPPAAVAAAGARAGLGARGGGRLPRRRRRKRLRLRRRP